MEGDIVAYLKNKYKPTSIILHGSRASHNEREHSDWDFVLLFDEPPSSLDYREIVEGQNIEVIALRSDSDTDSIIHELGIKLQYARVVFDTNGVGKRAIHAAQSFYAKGFSWPDGWPEGPGLFLKSKIDGMRDYIDEPLVFQKHLGIVYEKALNYWFQVLHKRYSQPVYLAVETIKKDDPTYFAHLSALASSSTTNQEKIEHAEDLHRMLFGA